MKKAFISTILGAALVATVGCDGSVAAGCFPQGCEMTLTCDDPQCNIDEDGDGISSRIDCNDNNPDVFPGAVELCGNGKDDDCDGTIICDGGTVDADGDDYGSTESGGTDCNDGDLAIHPAALEICDDGVDDDCDASLICDGGTTDDDGDEYGSVASGGTDCDDTNANIRPGVRELCGAAVDDNCDQSIICDGGSIDADGDEFASVASGGTDCDDADAAVNPAAAEDCGTPALESCGTGACVGAFGRVPVDGAALSAVLDVGGGVWLTGTDDGRLYRSDDDGGSWSDVAHLAPGQVSRLIRADAGTLAAAVARFDSETTGVWLSDDDGVSWSAAGSFDGLNGGHVTDLISAAGTPFGLWATTAGGGLYLSDDGGATFAQVGVGEVDPFAYAVAGDANDPAVVTVVSDLAVLQSTDTGGSFTAVLDPTPFVQRLRAVRLRPLDGSLFMLIDNGTMHESTDGGLTFVSFGTSAATLRPRDLNAAADGTLGLATRDIGFVTSSNDGSAWDLSHPMIGPSVDAVEPHGAGGFVVAGRRGLFEVDGNATRRLRGNMDGLDVRHVALAAGGYIALSGGDGTVWWSDNGGTSYQAIPTNSTTVVATEWQADGSLLIITETGTLSTWSGGEPLHLAQAAAPITAVAFDGSGGFAIAGGDGSSRLLESSVDTPQLTVVGGTPSSVLVGALAYRDGALLVGTVGGDVYIRPSSGGDLAAVTTSPGGGSITALLAVSGQPIYATIGGPTGGLFRSDDDGDTFAAVGTDTGNVFMRGGCIEPTSGTLGLISSASVFSSTDQGDTWQVLAGSPSGLYGFALPLTLTCAFEDRSGATVMWLPTVQRGVWLTELP